MRAGFALLTVFCLLGIVPVGGAQSPPAAEARVHDDRGDAQVRPILGDNLTKSPAGSHVDIVAAWIGNETDDEFEIGVQLAQWPDPFEADQSSQRRILASFQYDRTLFGAQFLPPDLARAYQCNANQGLLIEPFIGREYSSGRRIGCVNQTIEAGTGVGKMIVSKRLMEGWSKVPVVAGESLRGLVVIAEYSTGFLVVTSDRAPNTGVGPDLLLRKGGVQATGHLLLSSPMPARASNGESTTMVFPLDLRNDADKPDVAHLRVENANPEWTIRLPERVDIAAKDVTRVPLILSMNFTHLHGATQRLSVRAESTLTPGAYSDLALSIHWLTVPQPAGHHDRLWLHSRPGPKWGLVNTDPYDSRIPWMNALEKDTDPNATDQDVPADSQSMPYGDGAWDVPLGPDLAIGLDLDLGREGQFITKTLSTLPSAAATLVAQIVLCTKQTPDTFRQTMDCAEKDRVILGEGKAGPRPLAANAPQAWEVPLRFRESADLVPYRAGSNLFLSVRLQQEAPSTFFLHSRPPTPKLVVKDSQLALPLNEYHDPVDQAFQAVGSLSIKVLGPIEKDVNPGRATVFRLQVTNTGPAAQPIALSLEGINREWASLDRSARLELQAGATENVAVIVKAPEDAGPGERAELFFVAQSRADASVVALARMRVSVVDPATASIPNEEITTADADGGGKSPGAGLLLAIAAIGVAWRVRRPR